VRERDADSGLDKEREIDIEGSRIVSITIRTKIRSVCNFAKKIKLFSVLTFSPYRLFSIIARVVLYYYYTHYL
jgi:hypothetical protein